MQPFPGAKQEKKKKKKETYLKFLVRVHVKAVTVWSLTHRDQS